MIRITQTCERCKKDRDISSVDERKTGGWRVVEGFELCPSCNRDLKKWLEQEVNQNVEADGLQEDTPGWFPTSLRPGDPTPTGVRSPSSCSSTTSSEGLLVERALVKIG